MHQSNPAAPIFPPPPPPGNRGVFAHVVSPGGGALANFIAAWGLGISIARGDPVLGLSFWDLKGILGLSLWDSEGVLGLSFWDSEGVLGLSTRPIWNYEHNYPLNCMKQGPITKFKMRLIINRILN